MPNHTGDNGFTRSPPIPESLRIPHDKGQWTELTVAALDALWTAGYGTRSIGAYLGVTKNAVVGKVHRRHLAPRETPIRRNPDGVPTGPRPHRATVPTLPPLPSVAAGITTAPVMAVPRAPDARPRPTRAIRTPSVPSAALLIDGHEWRRRGEIAAAMAKRAETPVIPPMVIPKPYGRVVTCAWPIGEIGAREFHFCDVPSEPGRPYCEEHVKIAYVRVRDRQENAA